MSRATTRTAAVLMVKAKSEVPILCRLVACNWPFWILAECIGPDCQISTSLGEDVCSLGCWLSGIFESGPECSLR